MVIPTLAITSFITILFSLTTLTFKEEQLKYSRVRNAYEQKEADMLALLQEKQIEQKNLQVYLRAFKQEQELELWGRNREDLQFQLLKTYEVCETSGTLGPKRKQGDLQIPEGFYHIDRFNPSSNFHLSLGINYPNTSDRILGTSGDLGGDIFIHGNCVTIGCLPITDDQIKELYIFCVEARSNGQTNIPVTIFPARLDEALFEDLIEEQSSNPEIIGLWTDLKEGFDAFNSSKQLPNIQFLNSGRHTITGQ